MENNVDVSREIELAELKKETLRMSFELANAQANSIMLFTLQWKDLEDQLDSTMKSIEEKGLEVDLKQKSLEERERAVELKEIELASLQSRIEECDMLLERKIEELRSVRSRIEGCKGELKCKESELGSIEKKIGDRHCEYQLRVGEIDELRKSSDELSKKLSVKREELSSVEELIEKRLGELKEHEELRKCIRDCSDDEQVLELRKSTQLSENTLIDSPPANPLQFVTTVIEGSSDLMPAEVSAVLSVSPDPAKFVLDLIRGSYYDNQKKRGRADIQQVIAMVLAFEWKRKLRIVTENSLEVSSFLQLLITYELVTAFDKDEILRLLFTVSHLKQVPEICMALGFADVVPGFVHNLIKRNIQHMKGKNTNFGDSAPPNESASAPMILPQQGDHQNNSSSSSGLGNQSRQQNSKIKRPRPYPSLKRNRPMLPAPVNPPTGGWV
ncbi:hypothetical protein JRO89_XS04G0180100 [Xanthoceras sorbifolium]|uniref:FRIGIDA-like protein n=1 Tax=Xanthoceras sorbifolium TaxID=99658 RepID=A0ABQ8I5S7_9ROSI|nr:hypothetical protein JRO89_XS04G0180100 [Xanthoceras sorbifolium]